MKKEKVYFPRYNGLLWSEDSCNMDKKWLSVASFYKIKQLNEAKIKIIPK